MAKKSKTQRNNKSASTQATQAVTSGWHVALDALPPSYLTHCQEVAEKAFKNAVKKGRLFVVGLAGDAKGVKAGSHRTRFLAGLVHQLCLPAYRSRIEADLAEGKESLHFPSAEGPVWVIARKGRPEKFSHQGRLEESDYSWFRDRVGHWFTSVRSQKELRIEVQFEKCEKASVLGSLVALEVSAYQYKATVQGQGVQSLPVLVFKASKAMAAAIGEAIAAGRGVNLARHLVNTPPNQLNPETFAKAVVELFSRYPGVQVEVWESQRLKQEGMNLMLAVGAGGQHAPRMVHIRYRPKQKGKRALRPLALVGKGITFDSGGLDIKPSSGMRLMKKDMGGAAAVVGAALWAVESAASRPLDIYLALAENSVDERSFRPSDVIMARNGLAVEIHNTDAEGRLVLADVLDVAVKQAGDDSPESVINVATLTGAIKVALGAEIGGLFSNHDPLAEEIEKAAQESGDLVWRMPLFSKYTQSFSTHFADLVNAVDGFGGPITAALFLEKFVNQKPWAHLDIYAWADRAEGGFSTSGGNGQAVQCLIQLLKAKR